MSSTISPKDTLLQRAKCIKSISPAFTVHADRKSNLQIGASLLNHAIWMFQGPQADMLPFQGPGHKLAFLPPPTTDFMFRIFKFSQRSNQVY